MPKTADQLKWEGDGARICCQHQWQESSVINEARTEEVVKTFALSRWSGCKTKKRKTGPWLLIVQGSQKLQAVGYTCCQCAMTRPPFIDLKIPAQANSDPNGKWNLFNIVFGCRIIFYPTYYVPNQVKSREEMLQNQMRNLSKSNVKYVQS